MCSKLTTKRPEQSHSVFIDDFFFKVTYSGVFNVNFEHISHLQQHEICQNMNIILEKRKKSNKLNRFEIEVFPSKYKILKTWLLLLPDLEISIQESSEK